MVRVVVRTTIYFWRPTAENEGLQFVDGHFTTDAQYVSNDQPFDHKQLAKQIKASINDFNRRGSGWIFDFVSAFTVVVTHYTPLCSSSFIATPPAIAKRKAVVNV